MPQDAAPALPPFSPEEIGARITHLRESHGLSQAELGRICGVGRNTVSHWENGRQRPTAPQVWAMRSELGITLDWVYGGDAGGMRLDVARRLGLA